MPLVLSQKAKQRLGQVDTHDFFIQVLEDFPLAKSEILFFFFFLQEKKNINMGQVKQVNLFWLQPFSSCKQCSLWTEVSSCILHVTLLPEKNTPQIAHIKMVHCLEICIMK